MLLLLRHSARPNLPGLPGLSTKARRYHGRNILSCADRERGGLYGDPPPLSISRGLMGLLNFLALMGVASRCKESRCKGSRT